MTKKSLSKIEGKKPKVSILIPSYNQEDVIEQTLRSALLQTYENVEVIVSDDASTDKTPVILEVWQALYPKKLKIFLHKDNLGVTENHTRGLLKCTGEYITFLDGDDLFLPKKIERQVLFMQKNETCSICYHDVDVFDSETGSCLYLWSKRFGRREGNIKSLVRYGNYLPAVSVMVRRKHIPPQGYDAHILVYSDWFLWLNILNNGRGRICYLEDVLAKYRRHIGNLTNTARWKFVDQLLTLTLVETKWPYLAFFARMRRSEVQFMQAMNALGTKKYGSVGPYFLDALMSGFPFLPWVRLILREALFFFRNKAKSDDILKSILLKKT